MLSKWVASALFAAVTSFFSATWTEGAAAAPAWRWSPVGGGLTAKAAVSEGQFIWALDANDFISGQGYHIKQKRYNDGAGWSSMSGYATSLALDGQTNTFVAVALDNRVWYRDGLNPWLPAPNGNCEGGILAPRQVAGDNNIARTDGETWVITGNKVRRWNGACWHATPPLPSGSPIDIAQSPFASDEKQVWTCNQYGEIYKYTSAGSWVKITTGLADGMGWRTAIGTDSASVWSFNPITNLFTVDTTWIFGGISQLSQVKSSLSRAAVAANGKVYWYGYHQN